MPQLTSEPAEGQQERKMTRGAIRKRKLKLRQVKIPDVLDAEIIKAADEFGYDGASALIRDAIVKHIQRLRKDTPDTTEVWLRLESQRIRKTIRGVYSAIRLATATVSAVGLQGFIRHGDPTAEEYEANLLKRDEYLDVLKQDVGAIFQQDSEWFRAKTETEDPE